ncbi:hypothetical protein QEZ54_09805 [Catellatospora sp. KI3]|uniref:hypothetical protein n=1 Tax=Catellatospora sp. KI3 TaxID=3041620 RepID=UPI0024822496|nr:hypothetical protein [Catellatospora sp. KI3]MDI1461261.1 hypothetical protein [Catellatospora sp. KI3]
MRRIDVVANHDVWDVLDDDELVGVYERRPDAVRLAARAARANAPSHLEVVAADGRVEHSADFGTPGTAEPPA